MKLLRLKAWLVARKTVYAKNLTDLAVVTTIFITTLWYYLKFQTFQWGCRPSFFLGPPPPVRLSKVVELVC